MWQDKKDIKVTVVLQGGADRIVSVAIPVGFLAVGTVLLVGGLSNLYRGVGKEDQ